MVVTASWSVLLSALLFSLVVLEVSLPSVSLSLLSLGVAGSDLCLSLVKSVFQGEELGGTALGWGVEMGELVSAGGRVEEVVGQELGGGSGTALPTHLYSPVSCRSRMCCLCSGHLC